MTGVCARSFQLPLSFRGRAAEPDPKGRAKPETHNRDAVREKLDALRLVLHRWRLWVPGSRCARPGMTVIAGMTEGAMCSELRVSGSAPPLSFRGGSQSRARNP